MSNPLTVLFRVDASAEIGHGHAKRCLSLALQLCTQGADVHFVCRHLDSDLHNQIKSQGFDVHEMGGLAHDDLLYVLEASGFPTFPSIKYQNDFYDAAETIYWVDALKATVVVVDNYELGFDWQRTVRASIDKLVVLDDFISTSHDCDIYINPGLLGSSDLSDMSQIVTNPIYLIGPSYSFIGEEYQYIRKYKTLRNDPVSNVLVYFGGSNCVDVYFRLLQACVAVDRSDISFQVVGNDYVINCVEQKFSKILYPFINTHRLGDSLATLASQVDMCIGAAGSSAWERCCIGLPTAFVRLEPNQDMVANTLLQIGAGYELEISDGISLQDIVKNLEYCFNTWDRQTASRIGMQQVDGLGAIRAAAVIASSSDSELVVRNGSWESEFEIELLDFSASCEFVAPRERLRSKYDTVSNGAKISTRRFILGLEGKVDIGYCEFIIDGKNVSLLKFSSIMPISKQQFRNVLQSCILELRQTISGCLIFTALHEEFKNLNDGESIGNISSLPNLSFCTAANSWINFYVAGIIARLMYSNIECRWAHDIRDLPDGRLCFYLSYESVVDKRALKKHQNNLVVHASDLPRGRGWSPASYEIEAGSQLLTVCLLEAGLSVDSGDIYQTVDVALHSNDLIRDWQDRLGNATFDLILRFVGNYPTSLNFRKPQSGLATYWPRRTCNNSKLDINKSIDDQFNLLRVVDNEKYPAFFFKNGQKYIIRIKKS